MYDSIKIIINERERERERERESLYGYNADVI